MDTHFHDTVWDRLEQCNPSLKKDVRLRIYPSELKRIAKRCYDAGVAHTREQYGKPAGDMPDFLKGLFR